MTSVLPLGLRFDFEPVPPVAEDTTSFTAGPLSIGVEYRVLDDATVAANYSEAETAGAPSVDDRGVSIHVCDAETGHEYLRFDCFDVEPHYHYLHPELGNTVVVFDRSAHGEMLEWTLAAMRTRLPSMLEYAGGGELAGRLDTTTLDVAATETERLARSALAAL
jgi:hypothetical protein